MTITDIDGFNRLCRLSGIIDDYYDISGQHHVASLEAKRSLLTSMGIDVESDEDVHLQLEQIDLRDWQTEIAPVLVYQKKDAPELIRLTLNSSQVGKPVQWQLLEENGETHRGEWFFDTHQAVDEREINSIRFYRFEAQLPSVAEMGYHRLSVKLAGVIAANTLLIVTPETCYQPAKIEADNKIWGVGLQLYSLRSTRNWGIGDFTDLQSAIEILAPLGVDVIGLNPLHALFAHLPENASPYSPSSRDFLNPIYLDIESIQDFGRCDQALSLISSSDFQRKLQFLRDTDLVQYTEVWSLKMTVLKLLYEQFRNDLLDKDRESVKQFRQYQNDKGEDLFKFALFEALQAFFHEQDASIETWQQWPEEFHNPESNSVKNWAESNLDKIEFYQYLQWQAQQQLSACQADCQRLGMRIGIYNDLAVGNEPFSAICWAEQPYYALDVGVGAPPDDFNLLGQNWGLPPQLPQALRDNCYRLFINTLRANMRHAGALRIDHVMGLMRLYWVPEGYAADQGTYVTYPFEDLLGILALESQRNRCLIVGEDLGTVPNEVRHQLWVKKILSYRILFFEKDWHHGNYRRPQEYPLYALCTSGSHDLPTLKGYWQSSDIDIRENLNLFPSDEIKHQQREARVQDKFQIKAALFEQNLIDEQTLHTDNNELSTGLLVSIQRFLARSESLLMMVQLEDLLSQARQLNVPGTIDEYSNWRHKISINLEDWCKQSEIENIAISISCERQTNA